MVCFSQEWFVSEETLRKEPQKKKHSENTRTLREHHNTITRPSYYVLFVFKRTQT